MKKTGKRKRAALSAAALMAAVSLLCGCSGGRAKSGDSEQAKASAEQGAAERVSGGAPSEQGEPQKTVKRTVQFALSEEQNRETVLDFGMDSVFGGIEVETDENGELVGSEQGGSVWYKVTDPRFGTYRRLSRLARLSMSGSEADEFLRVADTYFITSDGGLYFVDGAGGRTISVCKRYVMDGGLTVRVSSTHTAECRKKYGISRSSVDFVKSDGTWKLTLMRSS